MDRKEDKNTRYYIDINVLDRKVISWSFGDRFELVKETLDKNVVRIFITKGQYNKLK